MNHQNSLPGAGQGAPSREQYERARQNVGPTAIVVPLEQRLYELQRGLERLAKVRSQLYILADRLQIEPQPGCDPSAPSPPTLDLNGKFGEAVSYLHGSVDELEATAARLERALFENGPNKVQPTRNDDLAAAGTLGRAMRP